jgi:CRISPR-associated protein Cas2
VTAPAVSSLSGYRLMWMMVLFDLPVLTKKERKAATRFRNFLLDEGFEMSQFSVYLRFCAGKEQADMFTRHVERNVPETGKVHIVYFTDRQYENIVCFDGRKREQPRRNPEQFALF